MRYLFTFIILFSLITFYGCEDDDFVFDVVPYIELSEISTTNVTEFQDTITIRLLYRDGDGDLGFENPDSFSLSVQDQRLVNPDFYFVQPLAPIGSQVSIEGILPIKLKNTFLLGNGATETTTYTIRIKDRAGNWSNEVVTPVITIHQ